MDKLMFKGKEYELIEVPPYPKFRIYGKEYKDIGYNSIDTTHIEIPEYDCHTLRIKDKCYGLKLIKT
jgi:hypothetical protein